MFRDILVLDFQRSYNRHIQEIGGISNADHTENYRRPLCTGLDDHRGHPVVPAVPLRRSPVRSGICAGRGRGADADRPGRYVQWDRPAGDGLRPLSLWTSGPGRVAPGQAGRFQLRSAELYHGLTSGQPDQKQAAAVHGRRHFYRKGERPRPQHALLPTISARGKPSHSLCGIGLTMGRTRTRPKAGS